MFQASEMNCQESSTGKFQDDNNTQFHNVTGLIPYTSYTLSVAAVNPGGASKFQESNQILTDEESKYRHLPSEPSEKKKQKQLH